MKSAALLCFALCFSVQCFSFSDKTESFNESHIEVTLRMIGHEILLISGDSSSRVLPIIKNDLDYRIDFESDLDISADTLIPLIDNLVVRNKIASHYIVLLNECESGETAYSFEINHRNSYDLLPCRSREILKGCYSLHFHVAKSIIEDPLPEVEDQEASTPIELWLIPTSLILALLFFRYQKRKFRGAGKFTIGQSVFDKNGMTLHYKNKKKELSSKEAELLFLLYSSANNTIKREELLKEVWDDDGDYIGRTLDVFISKLRKKIESDASLRIVNIRGIGYKLIIE